MTDRESCPDCQGGETSECFRAPAFDPSDPPRSFAVRRCVNCGVTYTADVGLDVLDAAYAPSYYGDGSQKFSRLFEPILAFSARLLGWKISRARAAPARRILDVGCGRALLLRTLCANGATGVGIERGSFPGEPLDAGDTVSIVTGELDSSLQGEMPFDTVCLIHSLEHMPNPSAVLESVTRAISPGGLLVISVPNFASLQSRIFGPDWFHLDIPRHLYHFDGRWLRSKLDALEYDVVSISSFSPVQGVYGFVQSAQNACLPYHWNNRLYAGLKGRKGLRQLLELLVLLVVAGIMLPFAVLETIAAAVTGQGACITVIARKKPAS